MVSAVVLTKNNADTIRKTLVNLTWCDELVVVDDQSSDGTPQIVQTYGAHLYTHAVNGDFAGQRNFGLKKAKNDWVLFIDSDEVVPPALADEIQVAVRDSDIQGYYLKRQDTFLGTVLKHGETSTVRLLRLGRKNAGTWIHPVHEVWSISGNTHTLSAPLLHTSHSSVTEFVAKIHAYTTIYAKHLYESDTRVTAFDIAAYPIGKFIYNYFFRFGFLDGTAGAVMAVMMSFHSFLSRAKLWEYYQTPPDRK